MAMAAGLATLKELSPQIYNQLENLSKDFANSLKDIAQKMSIPSYITQVGSMIGIFFCEGGAEAFSSNSSKFVELIQATFPEATFKIW